MAHNTFKEERREVNDNGNALNVILTEICKGLVWLTRTKSTSPFCCVGYPPHPTFFFFFFWGGLWFSFLFFLPCIFPLCPHLMWKDLALSHKRGKRRGDKDEKGGKSWKVYQKSKWKIMSYYGKYERLICADILLILFLPQKEVLSPALRYTDDSASDPWNKLPPALFW